jgi:hypothetical protein
MVLNLPLDEFIDNTHIVTQEKRKIRKPKKGKKKDHLKNTSLGPLRQGQRLDTSETKLCSNKERNHQTKARKTHASSP